MIVRQFVSPEGTFVNSQGLESLELDGLITIRAAKRRQKLLPPLRGSLMENAIPRLLTVAASQLKNKYANRLFIQA